MPRIRIMKRTQWVKLVKAQLARKREASSTMTRQVIARLEA